MEEMYYANANAFNSSSSSAGEGDRRSSDDISRFLNQILHRSSVSSPTTPFFSSFANDAGNTPSFSIGGVGGNETDDYDCESEEGLEAIVEGLPEKPTATTRSSSKRSRAAEVHNLSEKRRRSRINEKMKALQNLIPNSNKTDKASMLDEAIEYLKQLQLQVQMLSIRNGISFHPMCLPRLLQPIQISQFSRELNRSQQMGIFDSVALNQGNAEQTIYDLQNQCTVSNQLSLPNMSTIRNSGTSLGIDSSVCAHFNLFPLPVASGEIGREGSLPHQHLNTDHSGRIPPGERAIFSKNIESSVVLSTSLQGN